MRLIISFFISALIFVVSFWLYKSPPKEINSLVGYRTERSKQSIEAWREANRFSVRILLAASIVMVFVTLVSYLLLDNSVESTALIVFINTMLLVIVIAIVIILTEKHLAKMFGKHQ